MLELLDLTGCVNIEVKPDDHSILSNTDEVILEGSHLNQYLKKLLK